MRERIGSRAIGRTCKEMSLCPGSGTVHVMMMKETGRSGAPLLAKQSNHMKILTGLLFAILLFSHAARAETTGERSILLVRQGAAALLRGKFKNAISAYDQALRYDKLSAVRKASIHSDRGVAFWRMNQPEEALKDFTSAIELNAQYPQAYNNMGNVYMDMKRPKEAIKVYTKAIEIAPTYGVAYNNRGSANFELGNYEAAIRDFSDAIRYLNLNAVPHNGRGKAFLSQGKNYAALRDFTRAVRLNKSYGMVYLSRARANAGLKRYQAAIRDYSRAINLAKMEPQLYFERGKAYQKQGDHYAAISDFGQVIDLAPGHARAYALRALSFGMVKKYDKAFSDADKAVELDPSDYHAYLSRGKIAKKKGDYDNALDDFKTVLELKKKNAEALKLTAQIYEIRKNKEEAVAWYQRSLAADPFMKGSREGLKRLTGTLPGLESEVSGEPVSGWVLSRRPDGKYYVSNKKYPYFYGFIEVYGKGDPKLLEWTAMKGAWRGFGLLRYHAGTRGEGENAVPLEYTAILNLKKQRLVSIEPFRWGSKKAKWKWGNGLLSVIDPDGMNSELILRKGSPKVAKSRPAGRDYVPSPWGDIWKPTRRSARNPGRRIRTVRKRRKRRSQKSILDWLFQ